jgi:hypothetical protein
MENAADDNEWNMLNLNDDETDHIKKISRESQTTWLWLKMQQLFP